MALLMKSQADYVRDYHNETNQERFDKALQMVYGNWDEFFNDAAVDESTKVVAAELLQRMVTTLVQCTSPDEVDHLAELFSTAHDLTQHPELVSLMSVAWDLDHHVLAALTTTAKCVDAGVFELRSDGSTRWLNRESSGDQVATPRERSAPSRQIPPIEAQHIDEESPEQQQPAANPPKPAPPSGSEQKQEKKAGFGQRAKGVARNLLSRSDDDQGNA